MRFRPKPPPVPPELLDRFGEPEHVFGPNVRYRVVSMVCGVILIGMGVLFFLLGVGAGGAKLPLSDLVSRTLAVPLVVLGAVVLIGTRQASLNWLFVCPGGLLRKRGAAWDSLGWAEVEHFEDASLTHKAVTIRQCRIVTRAGTEWGFLADQFAEYGRLREILRRKAANGRKPSSPGGHTANAPRTRRPPDEAEK